MRCCADLSPEEDPVRTRLRSISHVVRFISVSEWVYGAALIGFVVGLVPALLRVSPRVTLVFTVVGLVLGVLLAVRDTLALLGRWSAWTMRRRQSPINFQRPLEVPGLPVVVCAPAGQAAIDPDLDLLLPTAANPVRWSETRYRLPPPLAAIAPYVLRRSSQGRWPFNGPNVSLATDLTTDAVESSAEVLMREGDFFSALCSNELTGWVLTCDGESFDFWDRFVFDSRGRFSALNTSELNNGVGVSTLAITSDDMLVITLQSSRSQTSAGLWAPSGSGALEPRDVVRGGTVLVTTAAGKGAERELVEETRIPRQAIGRTEVIGYARWLDRGAKPEFYCVTALTVTARELGHHGQVHRPLSEERLWTAGRDVVGLTTSVTLDPDLVAGLARTPCWRGAGLVPQGSVLDDSVSLSLEMALDALARRLHHEPTFLDRLRSESTRTA